MSASVASGPAKRAERTPGAPPSAADSIPESSPKATSPVAAAAARALGSALAANVSPVSGGSVDVVGQRGDVVAVEQRGQLAHLVRVAGGEDQPHELRAVTARSCAACSSATPLPASASSASRFARDSGVRSAVAWTSMRPPSPVMTTLASTSALESSL